MALIPLQADTIIAGVKTVGDWNAIRPELTNFQDNSLWEIVYTDYFQARLHDRYLKPIQSIKAEGNYGGEGFSIMTIICSLIEFLETTYVGTNYKYSRNNVPALAPFEYSYSGDVFASFLMNRLPFSDYFDLETAKAFYSNVRCGLLHEARTNGSWTIRGCSSSNELLRKKSTETIVYRDNMYEALVEFIDNFYRSELLASDERKEAFIRKFDRLCQE